LAEISQNIADFRGLALSAGAKERILGGTALEVWPIAT